ncbi:MAG: hypothetical protein PWQ89_270 [Verrucomicrobiota bacterium]|nr:hypothetical protein [Verrucomicrobiota bacterium]
MKNVKKQLNGLIKLIKQTEWIAVVAGLLLAHSTQAGVPLNSLQGNGGVAFNPLAYTSGQNKDTTATNSWDDVLSKPQFGAWYVSLGEVNVDWTAIGASETLFNRLELSYGYEAIAQDGATTIHKKSIGAKLLLISENAGGTSWVPAISVGTLYKSTDFSGAANDSAFDYYAVATKLITQLPRPVLVSGGVLSTKEQVTGVFGFNDKRDVTFFGNIDILPTSNIALGLEYKQGAELDDFKNADYWDAHAAWFANEHLTLAAAYVNTGDETSTSKVGLGNGFTLSAQYAF